MAQADLIQAIAQYVGDSDVAEAVAPDVEEWPDWYYSSNWPDEGFSTFYRWYPVIEDGPGFSQPNLLQAIRDEVTPTWEEVADPDVDSLDFIVKLAYNRILQWKSWYAQRQADLAESGYGEDVEENDGIYFDPDSSYGSENTIGGVWDGLDAPEPADNAV